MAVQSISYGNKTDLNTTSVPDANKVKASDMNEVKTVVNNNATELGNTQTSLSNLNTYSTSETLIGKWIDNKDLYRKVIVINNLPNNTYSNTAHNITNLDKVVNTYGIMTSNNETLVTPLNMHGTSALFSSNTVLYRINDTNVVIGTTTDYSSYGANIIIEYTKSS